MEEIADLIFSIFIGYVGALEFLYVVRHLYHWAGQHSQQQLQNGDASSLEQLQANLRQQLATATEREANSGHKAMQDGVLYEQGFRIEPNAKELEQLKQEQKQAVQQKEQRRKALEAELKKQKQIEEQTRQQLAAAEAALAAQRKQQEEEAAIAAENERRMLEAERQREAEEKALELAEETAKAAAAAKEAEGQHAAEQKALEQAEEAAKAAAAAEHEQRLLEAQRQREAEQRALEEAEEVAKATAEAAAEAEENERRLLEAERQREAEQRALEEGEEMAKAAAAAEAADHEQRLLEAERQREAEQRALEEAEEVAKAAAAAEAAEHEQRLLEAQRQREAEQRALEEAEEVAKAEAAAAAEAEAEENERRLLEAEHQREAEQRALEEGEEVAADEAAENEREILDADPHSDVELNELESEQETESMQISADTADNLFEAERLREEEQRRRELEEEEEALENARKIIAADKLREIAQQQLLDAEEDAVANGNGDTPSSTLLLEAEQTTDERDRKQQLIAENARKFLEAEQEMVELQQRLANEPVVHKVKTQMNQTNKLLFPSLSDEGSSVEPNSSTQTSISTQPSEELNTTGNEQPQILHLQRQEPDGEDNIPSPPYTDEYLRSLDGIKSRSLLREDGSGRRRAFKKRRSSGSSNSSRDSRTSRDEELKMFTSLEEEEMQSLQKSDSDYTPIKYSTEQTLKVKGHHHRRHKRSPAKDAKTPDVQADAMRESLEMLDEENTNPWGEFVPEHYKHTEFWKREKALSIDEEEMEIDLAKLNSAQPTQSYGTSSFEEATHAQNEQVLAELQQHQEQTDELENKAMEMESAADAEVTLDAAKTPTESENKSNLIFSGEYTKAMDKDWHSGHFCCWQCDESLTGQRYVIRDDHPYCIKCYENVFANTCEECNKIIGIDSKDLSYKDKHWHEACFLCFKCHLSLVDKQFGAKADKIYCGNCYDAQFASRCDGCGEVFRAGTKKMEYKTRQWHENCFCCCVCKMAIGTKSFIPREQEIYCAGCHEEKFATRCIKCNKVITSGGVTYKNEPWHRECFTCTHCNITLAGQRFTSRDEKPYCAECFGELFAKRCTSCVKPITGIGGTRFISFEDRHWHHDCFVCASCKTSLVGRGFITDGPDIICPECAKQRM